MQGSWKIRSNSNAVNPAHYTIIDVVVIRRRLHISKKFECFNRSPKRWSNVLEISSSSIDNDFPLTSALSVADENEPQQKKKCNFVYFRKDWSEWGYGSSKILTQASPRKIWNKRRDVPRDIPIDFAVFIGVVSASDQINSYSYFNSFRSLCFVWRTLLQLFVYYEWIFFS